MMVKETQGEDWPLWLAYDTKVRCCSVTTPLDLSKFQQRLFDNLYICYTGKKILLQLQSTSTFSSSSTNPSSSSHFHSYQCMPDNRHANHPCDDSFCSNGSNQKTSTSCCHCLFCGGLSHSPKTCMASTLVNRRLLWLPKPSSPDIYRSKWLTILFQLEQKKQKLYLLPVCLRTLLLLMW